MTELRSQKMMAMRIMKCGITRVWIDPERISDVEEAITAEDIRGLIKDGVISAKQKKGNSNFRLKKITAQKKKGRRRGRGSRKGNVAGQKKRAWMSSATAVIRMLIAGPTAMADIPVPAGWEQVPAVGTGTGIQETIKTTAAIRPTRGLKDISRFEMVLSRQSP